MRFVQDSNIEGFVFLSLDMQHSNIHEIFQNLILAFGKIPISLLVILFFVRSPYTGVSNYGVSLFQLQKFVLYRIVLSTTRLQKRVDSSLLYYSYFAYRVKSIHATT
jgi:hypothetical protein